MSIDKYAGRMLTDLPLMDDGVHKRGSGNNKQAWLRSWEKSAFAVTGEGQPYDSKHGSAHSAERAGHQLAARPVSGTVLSEDGMLQSISAASQLRPSEFPLLVQHAITDCYQPMPEKQLQTAGREMMMNSASRSIRKPPAATIDRLWLAAFKGQPLRKLNVQCTCSGDKVTVWIRTREQKVLSEMEKNIDLFRDALRYSGMKLVRIMVNGHLWRQFNG